MLRHELKKEGDRGREGATPTLRSNRSSPGGADPANDISWCSWGPSCTHRQGSTALERVPGRTAWSGFHSVASRGQHCTSPGNREGGRHSLTSVGSTAAEAAGAPVLEKWGFWTTQGSGPTSKEPCQHLGQQTRLRTQPAPAALPQSSFLPGGQKLSPQIQMARPLPLYLHPGLR